MTDRNEMTSFSASMREMFRRMGLPDPLLVGAIKRDWDTLAGAPWSGRSTPVTIQGRTLVVEADSPSMIAFLRYGVGDLLRSLQARFGADVIDTVEVRGPSRAGF
jgi:hypothetical protein